MSLLWIMLLAVGASTAPAAPAAPACPSGALTTLAIEIVSRPQIPQHDQNIGSDRLILRSREGKQILSQAVNDGHLLCMGYAPSPAARSADAPGRYLIGHVGERGAWLVLGGISYLGEDGRGFEDSVFTRDGFLALTAISSPAGRFVAFVGGKSVVDGLYVLDARKDTVRRLGPPPAPPPLDFECDDPFQWGTCWADGYTAIEPRVLHFDGETTLVATYGPDTHNARAKNRRARRFKLAP